MLTPEYLLHCTDSLTELLDAYDNAVVADIARRIVKGSMHNDDYTDDKYFTVVLDCGTFTAESERIDDKCKAAALVQVCSGQTAVLSVLKKEIKTDNPPKLYDLTTLQRDANKHFGYTAKQTLDALQALYEAKLATYPRTDSQYLTDDMEQTAADMVGRVFAKYPQFGQQQTIHVQQCINNRKVTGHHAILPTVKITDANLSLLPTTQQNVLCLIAARLVLATAEPHRYEAVHATIRCAETDFIYAAFRHRRPPQPELW